MGSIPTTSEPQLLAPEGKKNSAASYLYTVAFVALLLLFSYLGQNRVEKIPRGANRMWLYAFQVIWEFILLGLVWIGARLANLKFKDLIGGRWKSFESVLLDFAIAIGFWFASQLILGGLGYLIGLADPKRLEEAKNLLRAIGPHSPKELLVWVSLSSAAGFCEEIIFRGYLQRQFAALLGNVWIGMLISAIIFGLSHGYEGSRRMLLIAVYGALFGMLTIWRKSLRPGMIAHAWHDSFQGGYGFFLDRIGKLK
jgi:membrane protease YdiL (CAAX protease family)